MREYHNILWLQPKNCLESHESDLQKLLKWIRRYRVICDRAKFIL